MFYNNVKIGFLIMFHKKKLFKTLISKTIKSPEKGFSLQVVSHNYIAVDNCKKRF